MPKDLCLDLFLYKILIWMFIEKHFYGYLDVLGIEATTPARHTRNFCIKNIFKNCQKLLKNCQKNVFFLILFFQKWPVFGRKRVWGSKNRFYIINQLPMYLATKKIMLKHKIWEQIFEVLSCLFASFYLACLWVSITFFFEIGCERKKRNVVWGNKSDSRHMESTRLDLDQNMVNISSGISHSFNPFIAFFIPIFMITIMVNPHTKKYFVFMIVVSYFVCIHQFAL